MALRVTPPPTPPATSDVAPAGIAARFSNTRRKLRAKSLKDTDDWYKILAIADWGSGKTWFLIGLLKAGLKVFVLDVDFGGTGLRTVKSELKRLGLWEDLQKNLVYIETEDYDEFYDFIENPEQTDVELANGKIGTIYDFDPDFVCLEGLTNFQLNVLDEYVLGLDPMSNEKKTSIQREKGLVSEQRDWDVVRRGTMRPLHHFLMMHNAKTGKKWHKYVTVHLAESKDVKEPGSQVTKEHIPEGPLLQGVSRKILGAGFDLIIKMVKRVPPGGKAAKYEYLISITERDSVAGKNRGLNVDPVEPADPERLWYKITEQAEKLAELEKTL